MTKRADVVVIGAGPAGIAAAVSAAAEGADVALVDEAPEVGGQIWRHRRPASLPADARRWIERLHRTPVRLSCSTAVVDAWRGEGRAAFSLRVERGAEGMTIEARTIVLATGARERFLPFPGWTLPGVIGIGGAQALLKQGMSVGGKRIVIAGTGPLLLPVAAALAGAGARLAIVAEQASLGSVAHFAVSLWRDPGTLADAVRYRARFASAPYATGVWVAGVEGASASSEAGGGHRVCAATLTDGRRRWTVPCDILCTGYGLVPNVELPLLLGCAIGPGGATVDARQETTVAGVFAAGETTGVGGAALATVEGEIAGRHAARSLAGVGDRAGATAAVGGSGGSPRGRTTLASLERLRDRRRAAADRLERAFTPRGELRSLAAAATIVCRCEDVPRGALDGSASMREAKLVTRAGMGACQGRVCGPALEFLFGWSRDTVRVPAQPARLSTLLTGVAAEAPPASFRSPTGR